MLGLARALVASSSSAARISCFRVSSITHPHSAPRRLAGFRSFLSGSLSRERTRARSRFRPTRSFPHITQFSVRDADADRNSVCRGQRTQSVVADQANGTDARGDRVSVCPRVWKV